MFGADYVHISSSVTCSKSSELLTYLLVGHVQSLNGPDICSQRLERQYIYLIKHDAYSFLQFAPPLVAWRIGGSGWLSVSHIAGSGILSGFGFRLDYCILLCWISVSRLGWYFLRGIFLMDPIVVSRLDGWMFSQRMFLVRPSDYVNDISKLQHTHAFHMWDSAHP